MSDETRFVRNRTGQPSFLKGHGVIQPGKEGVEVEPSPNLEAAIEARILEEIDRPTTPQKTSKQEAADEATALGIDFQYDNVTEAELRQLIADNDNGEEGGQ